MVILLSAIALCIDSYSLDRNRLFKYRVDAALSAKKAGRRQMSDGMKLGKGFGSPGSISEPETNEKNVLNPMVYSEANNLIQGASSLDQTSPLTKPTNSAISDLPDADAVFKKYGIGKGQSDRFGNEVKQPTSTGSKRTLKPGETRAFGECKKRITKFKFIFLVYFLRHSSPDTQPYLKDFLQASSERLTLFL